MRQQNPFPGLRPFEPRESPLFFGRDEQCDELLGRLSRRRLVAVVGASGSGKSSLVRAGLLPALQRGYLPTAGSSWRIALFRPGGSPQANLIDALLAGADGAPAGAPSRDELVSLLGESSLGLVAAARRLLSPSTGALLVVVDQFEEIFRFHDASAGGDAAEEAVECVNLLIGASRQEDVPVYVVLTMRSDYLGDCARFTGLPEALNDSQFLVPRMTREQLREAIEGPVAVGSGHIAPRLVQRLLHDVGVLTGRSTHGTPRQDSHRHDHDQLPVLQHALMRLWEVSADERARGGSIDLAHYEQPPIQTITHALDRHAEEVYAGLPSDMHRDVARRIFQRLTERDWENREVRRPTPEAELVAIATEPGPGSSPDAARIVRDILDAFASPERSFLFVNSQGVVDISHESFIRNWVRLREWVEAEDQSRRVYLGLAETAARWERGESSIYRGPELSLADRWWARERPTDAWARRYDPGFALAERFLQRSRVWQRARWVALAGSVAGIAAVAVLMTVLAQRARVAETTARSAEATARSAEVRARKAEADALAARNESQKALGELNAANDLSTKAFKALQRGDARGALALFSKSQEYVKLSQTREPLTPAEAKELTRLRELEEAARRDASDATARLKTVETQLGVAAGRISKLEEDTKQLREQLGEAEGERDRHQRNHASAQAQVRTLTEELDTTRKAQASLQKRLDDALAAAQKNEVAANGNYKAIYRRAVNLRGRQRWKEAAPLFREAAQIRGDTGEIIVMPGGVDEEEYLPNFYLGMALQRSGDCAAALQAWAKSEQEGKIKERKPLYDTLVKLRRECQASP